MKRFCLFVATGFGLGLVSPVAPGTVGSLPGVALAYATTLLPLWLQIPVCAALTVLAVPFCDVAEKILGIKDEKGLKPVKGGKIQNPVPSVQGKTLMVILLIAAVCLLAAGVFNGSARDVLGKAVNVCTECIGLG